jgi:hypothetical protein
MITGVRVAGRNDQVAGTKGSDVRTNGECVGTRYGVIYIGSEGNEGKPSEYRSRSLGTGLGERDLIEAAVEWGLTMACGSIKNRGKQLIHMQDEQGEWKGGKRPH